MIRILSTVVNILIFTGFLFSQTPNKYVIAFNVAVPDSVTNKSNYEIFTMYTDGSGKKNITNNGDVAWTYFAYKNKLYFISDRDTCYRCYFLYECDIDGSNIRKVSELQLEDSWMSSRFNNSEMIVSGRRGKEARYQLFIVNTETGHFRQITNDTAALHRDPVFSPDGRKIVFAYQKNKRDYSGHEELYIMNDDCTDMKQITFYPQDDTLRNSYGYKAGPPKWHPTENFITYQSLQAGKYSLYAVNPDGTGQRKLTDVSMNEGWHDWSSDGKWLAIGLSDSAQEYYYIGLMNWETKEMKILTEKFYKYCHAPVFIEK